MREARIVKPYTTTEIDKICKMYYEDNLTAKTVAELTGRSVAAIKQVVMRNNPYKNTEGEDDFEKIASAIPPKQTKPSTQATMTPREMIKALYDMGYRIENNQLVCKVTRVVKIQDIING